MSELDRFFATIEPFVFGASGVEQVERELGRSASGSTNLDFYRVLVGRNLDKILRELFAPLRILVEREHPGLWPSLVRDYALAHPPRARDPNWFGEAFADWLVARREAGGELSALYEELADYQFTRFMAASGPDLAADDEGFERRIFVRHYSHPIAAFVPLILRDAAAALPEPRPTTLVIARCLHPPFAVLTRAASLAELAALARREGLDLPPALAALPASTRVEADAALVERGILIPR